MSERTILVWDGLLRVLGREKNSARLGQVWRVFKQLETGNFVGAGAKPLDQLGCWQADVNEGDRLLFLQEQDEGRQYVVACELCSHDDSIRRARRFDRPCLTGVKGRLFPIPSASIVDSESFCAWVRRPEGQIEFLLAPEQLVPVRRISTTHVEGSAGTGKTTVLVHALRYRLRAEDGTALYVTFSEGLLREASKAFAGLEDGPALIDKVTFETIDQLVARLSGIGTFPLSKVEFDRWASRLQLRGLPPIGAVWAEIRGVLRGRDGRLDKGGRQRALPLEQYKDLPKRYGVCDPSYRPRLHEFCLSYERFLIQAGRFDSMDLAALAHERLPEVVDPSIRWIVVDEIQDLTCLQVAFLKEMGRLAGAHLLVAGDVDQTIYPSAFRWADVFDSAAHRHVLTTNYRCVEQILDLADGVLQRVKAPLIKRYERAGLIQWVRPAKREHATRRGGFPRRIIANQAQAVELLSELGPSPRVMVLARGVADYELLCEELGEGSVDELDEFKGLEQETVILYRFFAGEARFWRQYSDGASDSDLNSTLHAVNRLYVAVTRARENLIFIDHPDDCVPWVASSLDSLVHVLQPPWEEFFDLVSSEATPEEWLEEAVRREQFGRFAAARGAYDRANDYVGVQRCTALLAEQSGDWSKAGGIWFELEHFENAIRAFEQAGDRAGVQSCEGEIAERDGDWEGALAAWMGLAYWDRHGAILERLGRFAEAKTSFQRCSASVFATFLGRLASNASKRLFARL